VVKKGNSLIGLSYGFLVPVCMVFEVKCTDSNRCGEHVTTNFA